MDGITTDVKAAAIDVEGTTVVVEAAAIVVDGATMVVDVAAALSAVSRIPTYNYKYPQLTLETLNKNI